MVEDQQLEDGNYRHYFAVSFSSNPDINWGNSESTVYLATEQDLPLAKADLITLALPTSNNAEIKLNIEGDFKASELSSKFLEFLQSENSELLTSIQKSMQGKRFEVSYTDKYLKTPSGILLLYNFLDNLSKKLEFSVESINLNLSNYYNNDYMSPYLMFQDYGKSDLRDVDLRKVLSRITEDIVISDENLTHYRYFEFKCDAFKLIIRPDGGVEHGWRISGDAKYLTNLFNNNLLFYKFVNYDIIYYVSIENLD